MSLFKRKKELSGTLFGDPIYKDDPVNYDQVLEYLVGLSGDDYTKICQVAAVYRQADFEAAKVLGVENEPTAFITPPEPASDISEPDFLDEISDKPKKSTKIKVNQ